MNAQDQVIHALRTEVQHGKNVINTMTAEMQRGSFAVVREVEWLESRMEQITMSAICERILELSKEHPLLTTIKAVREDELRCIMNNSYRSNSTSQYHNAVEGSKREAACRFMQKADFWIKQLQA